VLDVPGETMLEKMRHLEREADGLRRLILHEPRGMAPLSGDIVFPSKHADAGFVIMESSSYEGMSGTNTLNTAAVLLETGLVEAVEPVTELVLEAPGRTGARARRRARGPGRADHVRERAVVRAAARRQRRGARAGHARRRHRLRRRVLRVRRRRGARLRDRARRGARPR
jgi:proline racemase